MQPQPDGPSIASKTAQGAPTHIVTSNAAGDLAAYTFDELGLDDPADIISIQNELNALNARIDAVNRKADKAIEGVAMAFAMAGAPNLLPHERFAMTGSWGTFEGENGLAVNAVVRLAKRMQLNGGVAWGLKESMAGGRVGLRLGW